MLKVNNIREQFIDLYKNNQIAENGTVEIINASFISDEETIFGELNKEYAEREIEWYLDQSLNIKTMKGDIPKIWKDISGKNGEINSNYGWCILSEKNYDQFMNVIIALRDNKYSRQASMIYIRPSMHYDCNRESMKDFICTFAAQLFIRNNKLEYLVYMRSNDAVFGYKNDRYWHEYVFNRALATLKHYYPDLEKGNLLWNAASLHVYPRHFKFLE